MGRFWAAQHTTPDALSVLRNVSWGMTCTEHDCERGERPALCCSGYLLQQVSKGGVFGFELFNSLLQEQHRHKDGVARSRPLLSAGRWVGGSDARRM